MSKPGFFLVARGVLDHPRFKPTGPFTDFEAWIWLIDAAVFEPTKISIMVHRRRVLIELARGQLSYSIRYLSKAWRWSPGRVRRFLDELKSDGSIDTQTDTDQTVITLCNYEHHQARKKKVDTHSGTQTDTHPNTQTDTNKKEIKELKEEKEGGAVAQTPVLVHSADPGDYAFEGNTVRILSSQFDHWRKIYSKIPDLMTALQAADDYYTENPPADGKWFFKVSNWLKKDNDTADAKRKQHLRDMGRSW